MLDIEVRKAEPSERGDFMRLWKQFIIEDLANGGDILPSERNLKQMVALWMLYESKELPGINVAAFDGDQLIGVTMTGQTPSGSFWLESPRGVSVTIWGEYVLPAYRRRGVSHKMLNLTLEYITKFEGIYFAYTTVQPNVAATSNALRFGATIAGQQVIYEFGS